MAKKLGIYFGIKGIDIILGQGKSILASINIPQEKFSPSDGEEKISQDVKIVALIKDELRKHKLEIKDAAIALSGRDLIIRSFELPSALPRDELASAIDFEVKKYLPFKVEDLISDFKLKLYKKEKRNLILFFGIKTETMKTYLSIMDQLDFRVTDFEYSAFSILRLMNLLNIKTRGVVAFMSLDLEDETNFMVLEDGFPLFSRDIEFTTLHEPDTDTLSAKLKNEIQLSLDYYYHRRFPSKTIERIIFFAKNEYKEIINKFNEELDLSIEFIDITTRLKKGYKFNLSAAKAFTVSLANTIKLPIKFDLLTKWQEEHAAAVVTEGIKRFSLKEFQPDARAILLSGLIIILSILLGIYPRFPLTSKLEEAIKFRPKLLTVSEEQPYEQLESINSDYKRKIDAVDKLLANYPYLTPQLDALPQLLAEKVWLSEYNYLQKESGKELTIRGFVYFEDRNKEIEAVNELFSNIKNNPQFSGIFQIIDIVSIQRVLKSNREVTSFVISCK